MSAPRAGGADLVAARERLWAAVADGDEHAAETAVLAALGGGAAAESVLLDVIAPVQAKVGAEWAANRMSVAQEHAATAINGRVIAAMAHHPAARPPDRPGRVVVACVDGEWHALPARLLAEVLRLRGWRVDFLGAQVPTPQLVAHLHLGSTDAVALSSSLPTRLPTAHAAITACLSTGVPVLAGGAAFGADGRHARLLGATAWAPDARAAADLLAEGLPRPDLAAVRLPVDDLPHLADQEHAVVARTAQQLVKQTLADLEERPPTTTTPHRPDPEDVAHVVEFLAAALYVDDDELFGGFVTWTGDILAARDVPAASLHPVLELLAALLTDLPRATRMLHGARRALDTAHSTHGTTA